MGNGVVTWLWAACSRCGEQTVQMLQQRWHAIVTRELGFKNLEEMQVRVSV